MNRLHKDGTWTLEDASQKWAQACQLLAASNLTPESGNVEENERVFIDVMGLEHSGRVRCKGLGVTPSRYHPHSSSSTANTGASRNSSSMQQIVNLQGEIGEMRQEQGQMKQGMGKMEQKIDQVLELLTKQSQGITGTPPLDDDSDVQR